MHEALQYFMSNLNVILKICYLQPTYVTSNNAKLSPQASRRLFNIARNIPQFRGVIIHHLAQAAATFLFNCSDPVSSSRCLFDLISTVSVTAHKRLSGRSVSVFALVIE